MSDLQGGSQKAEAGQVATPAPLVVMRWMAARNPVFELLKCEILEARAGFTRLAMPVAPDISNTFGVAHGGILFAFADLCFGFTANAAQNIKGVSASAEIHWLSSGLVGDRVIGEATEVWRKGRNGLYDVKMSSEQTGEMIAIVHGRMRFVGGPVMVAD